MKSIILCWSAVGFIQFVVDFAVELPLLPKFALLQTPHSLTSADLIQTLESQFGQQLSVWTPQAKQLKALTALPAEQSYQVALEGLNAASSTTHPGWNLH